jgi:putative transposase
MPRPPRIQVPDGTYHLIGNACAGRRIFHDRTDWTVFESILADVVLRYDWECEAYAFLTTHYHLLARTPQDDLSAAMHRLNGGYAQYYNRRYATRGHVFGARYTSVFVQTQSHLLDIARYIALNPVDAGLCTRPADWRWSSYAQTIGLLPRREFLKDDRLVRAFAEHDAGLGRARFRTFVEDWLDEKRRV